MIAPFNWSCPGRHHRGWRHGKHDQHPLLHHQGALRRIQVPPPPHTLVFNAFVAAVSMYICIRMRTHSRPSSCCRYGDGKLVCGMQVSTPTHSSTAECLNVPKCSIFVLCDAACSTTACGTPTTTITWASALKNAPQVKTAQNETQNLY